MTRAALMIQMTLLADLPKRTKKMQEKMSETNDIEATKCHAIKQDSWVVGFGASEFVVLSGDFVEVMMYAVVAAV